MLDLWVGTSTYIGNLVTRATAVPTGGFLWAQTEDILWLQMKDLKKL